MDQENPGGGAGVLALASAGRARMGAFVAVMGVLSNLHPTFDNQSPVAELDWGANSPELPQGLQGSQSFHRAAELGSVADLFASGTGRTPYVSELAESSLEKDGRKRMTSSSSSSLRSTLPSAEKRANSDDPTNQTARESLGASYSTHLRSP